MPTRLACFTRNSANDPYNTNGVWANVIRGLLSCCFFCLECICYHSLLAWLILSNPLKLLWLLPLSPLFFFCLCPISGGIVYLLFLALILSHLSHRSQHVVWNVSLYISTRLWTHLWHRKYILIIIVCQCLMQPLEHFSLLIIVEKNK